MSYKGNHKEYTINDYQYLKDEENYDHVEFEFPFQYYIENKKDLSEYINIGLYDNNQLIGEARMKMSTLMMGVTRQD